MNDLDDFMAAYRARVLERLQAEPMRPDVADVVDRALAMDEAAVPPGLRSSLGAVAEHDDEVEDELGDDLAAFAADYGARAARASDERRLSAVPAPTRSRRSLWIATTAIAAAAAAVLTVGLLAGGDTVSRGRDREFLEEAQRMRLPTGDTTPVQERGAERRRAPHPPDEDPVIEPEPEVPEQPATPDEADRSAPKPRLARSSTEALEERAHARWRAGDLEGAEADLRAIIRRSGRTRRAELAFGDLFAVAEQRGGEAAQTRVWNEYLRRFPRGRFSEDVEAGLCRRTPSERRSACWANYLRHHPGGPHAAEARQSTRAGER